MADNKIIRVSVIFFCHDGEKNFVLHKRSQNCRDERGKWDFGGGKLEPGEQPEDGALREIREEYGVVGSVEKQLPVITQAIPSDDGPVSWLKIPFFVRVNREKVSMADADAMDEIGWFRLDTLPQPLHIGIPLELDLFADHFAKYR